MKKRAWQSSYTASTACLIAARVFLFCAALLGLLTGLTQTGHAGQDPRVLRQVTMAPLVHWQLARWSDGATVCNLYLRHDKTPSIQEVSNGCGESVLQNWLKTPICDATNAAACSGLLLRQLSRSMGTLETQTVLSPISLEVLPLNCPPGQVCNSRPQVRVLAKEPAQGYQITRVHVRIADVEKIYDGADAVVRLPLTDDNGGWITYWAESSLGDISAQVQMKYRVAAIGTEDAPAYQFDLIGAAWKADMAPGVFLWELFPPSNAPLAKPFEQPLSHEYLTTTHRLITLSGRLIQTGRVDTSACDDHGVLSDGGASACGEKAAAPLVFEEQNKYDRQIFQAAVKYNIPARLLKGIIAQESQFWPSENPYERGLGHVTENGISMLLMWNLEYYQTLCMPIYDSGICWGGYSNLREDRATVIRRNAFDRIGSPEEIDLLGALLYASAAQTSQMMNNVFHQDLSKVTTYEDMWKISVANYNAGSGCVGESLRTLAGQAPPITWELVSTHLAGVCAKSAEYVQRVEQLSQ